MVIVEVKTKRQYLIRMCCSGRIALRNRRHLQKVSPTAFSTQQSPTGKDADCEDNQMPDQQSDEYVHDDAFDMESRKQQQKRLL